MICMWRERNVMMKKERKAKDMQRLLKLKKKAAKKLYKKEKNRKFFDLKSYRTGKK